MIPVGAATLNEMRAELGLPAMAKPATPIKAAPGDEVGENDKVAVFINPAVFTLFQPTPEKPPAGPGWECRNCGKRFPEDRTCACWACGGTKFVFRET